MIKLTETIVKRPVAALVIIVAVMVFGFMSIVSMPQEINPDMEMPMLMVQTIYPGAGPSDVESLISSLIKDALGTQSGLQSITSQSMENISFLILQYEFGYDMDRAYNEASRAIDVIINDLPDDAFTPVIAMIDVNAMATMTLSVHSETRENLLHFVEDEIVPQLIRLSGVASVNVSGGQEDYIRVEVNEEAMAMHGLGIHDVIAAVAGINHTAPLGTAVFGDIDLGIRVQVRHESIEALNNIPITLRTGGVIRLSDVANIHVSTMEAGSISRFNGIDTISLDIQNPQAVTANVTSNQVTSAINAIMAMHPDVEIVIVNDFSILIADTIFSVGQTLILAIILSMIILYLFLGDLRACLIVGSSMPISLLITFIFMDFMGYSLNLITLSGLIIGVGMMVDNAIVVIDSCFRSRKEGRSFIDAAVEGTKFVMLSIIAVTLTTVVVFVPIALIEGMSGQMFAPLGFSIVFALVASLMSAVSLVPLFFVQFKPVERANAPITKIFVKLESGYARLLGVVLNKKKTVVLITSAILVLAIFLATQMDSELMPPMDEGVINISISTRPGLNLESVDEILSELEDIVAVHPDVSHFMLTSGNMGSTLMVYLYDDRNMQTGEVIEQFRHETSHVLNSDIEITTGGIFGVPAAEGVAITLMGYSLESITEGAEIVENFMHQHPDIIRVNSTIARANPQGEIVVDSLMAATHGISPQMVTGTLFIALNGTEAAEINIDNQRFPVRVEYPRGRYESVSDMTNMLLMSPMGAMVPLSAISSMEFTETPQTITRQDGLYTVTITAVPIEAARFTAAADIHMGMLDLELPYGVRQGTTMMEDMEGEELQSLLFAVITAIFLVFMVMAIQFESIRHSLMVMTCIPLAIIGSFVVMFLTGTTINMISMLGFLVLIALVVNNGILFVDTTNKYRIDMPLREALIHAGSTRLRPILMITLTSILAMLPLSLGWGDEMMQGLGVTVIGGLTASTALALLFLPTFYLIIDGNAEKRALRKQRRTEKREKKIEAHL
ncbi:MAG: efflux RND transporter permease subunit [Defluviitaleaceae bacterium]|nr:efflux RND transporter permease subunit [Defluviitaleaceae bacterium]